MFATLNTGARFPLMGFGLAASDFPTHHVVKNAVLSALQAGYRHFDTSPYYKSEGPLGETLAEAFESGLVTREEVFVTTKLWCTDNYPDGVLPAIESSLSSLRLEYVDLYLIHWPIRFKKGADYFHVSADEILPLDIKGTWQVMEKCLELGLAKAIGVSNFTIKKIEDMLAYATIIPAVNQVEMHPKCRQKRLREYCNARKIHVSAYSPLGGPGQRWGSGNVVGDPTIKEIASNHGKSPAQVALRWGVEQGVSVIAKSYDRGRMVENMEIFDWELTEDDSEKISELEEKRTLDGRSLCFPTGHSPYKTVEDLWDGEI